MPHIKKTGLTDALAAIQLHADNLVPADAVSPFDAVVGAVINEMRPRYVVADVPRATSQAANSWLKLEAPEETATARVRPRTSYRANPVDEYWGIFELGGPSQRLVLRGDRGARLSPWRVGPSAVTQCMVYLADAYWAEPAFARAAAQFGEEAFASACVAVALETVRLRHQALSRGEQQQASTLLDVFETIAKNMPRLAWEMAPRASPGIFSAPLTVYAARFLDAEALHILFTQHPAAQTKEAAAQSMAKMMLMAAVAMESKFWSDISRPGEMTVRCIIEEISKRGHALPWYEVQESRDSVLLMAIKAQRASILPVIAEENKRLKSAMDVTESPYLLWAIRGGWIDGVHELLRQNCDPNAREPGVAVGHTRFGTGETPLIAALTCKAWDDATALQIASRLIECGALPFLARAAAALGTFQFEPISPELAAARAGLKHRWEALSVKHKTTFRQADIITHITVAKALQGLESTTRIQSASATPARSADGSSAS